MGNMFCSIHLLDWSGVIFHPDEHVPTISTTEVPLPAIEFSNAFRMAALALRTATGCRRLTCHQARAVELCQQVGNLQRISVKVYAASVWRSGCLLPFKRSRRHLAACHSVYGVVDKYYGYVLAAVGSMYRLCRTDCGRVAVALICEHHVAGVEALHRARHSWRTAMGGLNQSMSI